MVSTVWHSRHVPMAEDWAGHQLLIKRLYVDEKKTLKEVMEYMETHHDFRATTKMYKFRFKKWKLEKNIKLSDAVAIIQEAAAGEVSKVGGGDTRNALSARGEGPAYLINGRKVLVRKIERYMKRRYEEIRRELLAETGGTGRIPYLPPSCNVQAIEKVALLVNAYVDGAFRLAEITALVQSGGDVVSHVHRAAKDKYLSIDFLILLVEGLQMLSLNIPGTMRPGFEVLNRAFDLLQRAVVKEDPYITLMLPRALYTCLRMRRPEIYVMILRNVYQWSSLSLGKNHPLRHISVNLLTQLGTSEPTKDSLGRLSWTVAEHLFKTDDFALYNLILLIGLTQKTGYLYDSTGCFMAEEKIASTFLEIARKLLEEQQMKLIEPTSVQIIFKKEVRCMEIILAANLYHQDKYNSSLEILEGILAENHHGIPEMTEAVAFRILGYCALQMGQLEKGVNAMRQALKLFDKAYGNRHPATLAQLQEYITCSQDPDAICELERRIHALQVEEDT